MAGEFERLKWVLQLSLDDTELRRGVDAIEARFNRALQSARTPGSGQVTGGPNSLSSQAGEIAALKGAVLEQLRTGVRQGTITQDAAQEARARLRKVNVESFTGALDERRRGKVDIGKAAAEFNASRDAVLTRYLRAEKEAAEAAQAQAAAQKRAEQATIAKAAADEKAAALAKKAADAEDLAALKQAKAEAAQAAKEQAAADKAKAAAAKKAQVAEEKAAKEAEKLAASDAKAAQRQAEKEATEATRKRTAAERKAAAQAEREAKAADTLHGKVSGETRANTAVVNTAQNTALLEGQKFRALVEEQVSLNKLNAARRREVRAVEEAAYKQQVASGEISRGTATQRLQAYIAQRQGGNFRNPNEFLNLKQLLTSRALTTVGFGLSAALTYGAVQAIRQVINEGSELERIFSQIQAQFGELNDTNFAGFRAGILNIARDSGLAATEVAHIALQFKGAFGKRENDTGVLQEVQAAVEISKVTGLSLSEITDSLTAAALSYDVSVRSIGDATLAIQERTGVLAKETITAVADLAPVANQVGLSMEKVAAIAGVAQERSGRSGTALAEGLNRILPAIQKNGAAILTFFKQVDPSNFQNVLDSLSQGKTGEVLDLIGRSFSRLSVSQQNFIIETLGGRREAQNIIPVLKNYGEVLDLTSAAERSAGRTHEYYSKLQETLGQQLARLGVTARQLGEAILRSGVSEALQEILKGLRNLLTITGGVLSFFADFNDVLGGIPGKVIAITLAVLALTKAIRLLAEASVLKNLAGIIPGIGAKLTGNVAGGAAASGGFRGLLTRFGILRTAATAAPEAGSLAAFAPEGLYAAGGTGALATAGSGAGIGALGATGIGLAVIGGVVALNRYMDRRNNISKDAKRKLESLVKLDAPELAKLREQNRLQGVTNEGIGRFLTGNKTDEELVKDAQQIQQGSIFKKQVEKLRQIYEGDKKGSKFLDSLLKDLTEHPENDDTNSEAKHTLDLFTRLSKDSSAQITILGEASRQGVLGGPAQGPDGVSPIKSILDERKKGAQRLVEIQNRLKTATGKEADNLRADATRIRKDFFGSDTTSSATDLLQAATAASAEFDKSGTVFGFKPGEFAGLHDFIDHLGTNIKAKMAALANLTDANAQLSNIGQVIFNVDSAANAFKRGTISRANYAGVLRTALEASKQALAGTNEDTPPEVLKQLEENVDKYKTGLFEQAKAASDARIQTKVRGAQLAGANTGLEEKIRQQAIGRELRINQDLGPTDRTDYANQYIQSVTAQREFLAKEAGNVEKGWEILRQPIPLPPEIQTILNEETVRGVDEKGQNTLDAVEKLTGIEDQTFITMIAQAMTLGKSANATIRRIVTNKLRVVQFAIAEAIRNAQDPKILAGLLEQQRIAQALLDGLDKGTTGLEGLDGGKNKTTQGKGPTDQEKRDRDLALAQADARLAAAQSGGDPIADAQAQIKQGQIALQHANGDALKIKEAQTQIAEGNRALSDAVNARQEAYLSIALAQADGDPIKEALINIQLANEQIAHAHGDAAKANALANRIRADHALRDALNAAQDAQSNLVIALLQAGGKTIEAAREQVRLAKEQYARAAARYGPDSAQARDANRNLVQQEASLRDTNLQSNLDDIQFDLDMKKISTAQAIARLQNQLAAANLTESQRRDIQRQIKSLKDKVAGDLQFNLPDIILPTFYEARRLKQQGAGGFAASFVGQGPQYSDNRSTNINIFAQTNASPQSIAAAVAKEMNKPSTFGTRTRLY